MFQRQKNYCIASLDKSWESMDNNQRTQYTNSVKAKAAVMLIQATQFVQSKNIDKAKELLVQIAESCMSVIDPDEQITKWIQISCTYLAILHKNMQQKKSKSTQNLDKKSMKGMQNLLVLKYNKFSGEFQVLEQEEGLVNQELLQYISKINMILFGCQNVENNHSLYVMFCSYWVPFTIAFLLLVISFVFLTGQTIFLEDESRGKSYFQIPAIIIGGLLVLPFLMIFLKVLQQRDNTFFQKKLGQQIKRINEDCRKRGNNIEFKMPLQGQINVKFGKLDQFYNQQLQNNNILQMQINETPEDELMDKIKGLTREISKISGASISQYKN